MSNLLDKVRSTSLDRLSPDARTELARALQPGAPVFDIVEAFMTWPMRVEGSTVLDQVVQPGQVSELVIPAGAFGIVNKVTPEQLLAVVVSIIATSKGAAEACSRIRREVEGWQFQMEPDGPRE